MLRGAGRKTRSGSGEATGGADCGWPVEDKVGVLSEFGKGDAKPPLRHSDQAQGQGCARPRAEGRFAKGRVVLFWPKGCVSNKRARSAPSPWGRVRPVSETFQWKVSGPNGRSPGGRSPRRGLGRKIISEWGYQLVSSSKQNKVRLVSLTLCPTDRHLFDSDSWRKRLLVSDL